MKLSTVSTLLEAVGVLVILAGVLGAFGLWVFVVGCGVALVLDAYTLESRR